MPFNETGITDTGEQANPMNQKTRRAAVGWQGDQQSAMGDGKFAMTGARKTATNYGRPVMGPAARKRRGMR